MTRSVIQVNFIATIQDGTNFEMLLPKTKTTFQQDQLQCNSNQQYEPWESEWFEEMDSPKPQ